VPFERPGARVSRVLARAVRLVCPRCGATELFTGWFAMRAACPLCGLRYERAQGYWVGAIYVNYALTTGVAVAGYLALWAWADLATATQLAIWVPFCVLFPLWCFRYSRSLWLAVEFLLNPEP
jgi:uncharacterized protein (DUF983 family)